jgi:hypothetical protein
MIKHVLKDGSVVDSIEGHMIKAADYPVLYEVVNRIQKEGDNTEASNAWEAQNKAL